MKVQCEVHGKSVKIGWFFKSYFVTIHDLENDLMIKRQVPVEQYMDLQVGERILVKRFWY